MISLLKAELSYRLRELGGDLCGALNIRGATDRLNALTMICREALGASSLCYVGGEPHFFDGRCYVPCRLRDVLAVLGNVLVEEGVSPTDVRKMGDMPLSVMMERSFVRDGGLLCMENGVLDVERGAFRSGFDPSVVVTERLGYLYDASALCPLWDMFLAEVLPDPSVRAVLQEFFGMCYIDRGAVSVEKFAILIGSGANGKSVVRDVVTRAMGADNVKAYDAQQITRSDLVPFLIGKRINFASDMKTSASFDSALKALSSGQEVEGRKIYSDPVKVKCPPIVFSMNELPRFNDESPAFFRRVLLFRFDVVVPEERRDARLADRICSAELPGVLNWMLEGRRRLLASGGRFTPCRSMDAALDALRAEVSAASFPVRAYLGRMGYSVRPAYRGQVPVRLSCRDVAAALPAMTANAISREMSRLGVRSGRSRETYYEVYERP